MGFSQIIQKVVYGDDYIEEHHNCMANKSDERIMYFGDLPEERAENEVKLSSLNESDVVEIFSFLEDQLSFRIIDDGLSESELLLLDNLYAACCSYHIRTGKISKNMIMCGLLTIESDTRFYPDLQKVGNVASGPFDLIGKKAEQSYNEKMWSIWDRFDKTVSLLLDVPNIELIYTPEEKGYKPFINYNTYSHGKLGWFRAQQVLGRELTKHGKKEKRFLAKGLRQLENCLDAAYDVLEGDQYEYMIEKLEEVRNRYT